jgi:nicotinamide-nucleotide amidase
MYNQSVINTIKNILVKRNQTLAVAESVTSGHLQAALSLADGATLFFQGGITAYNLGQKSRHLKVNPILAESCNCVSEKITQQMAVRTLELFSSEWAIAITGYAAPVPEIGIHDLYAFISIANEGQVVMSKKITAQKQDLFDCQLWFTQQTLEEFSKILQLKNIQTRPMLSEH